MNIQAANAEGMHPVDGVDWDTIWFIERDICFLYHELAEYPGINGDLAFSRFYNRAYWKCLVYPLPPMRAEEEIFLCSGCLMLINAMCWDILDGSGSYLLAHLDEVHEAVANYFTSDKARPQEIQELTEAVWELLEAIRTNQPASPQMEEEAVWANETFVLGYFARMAQDLQNSHNSLNPGTL